MVHNKETGRVLRGFYHIRGLQLFVQQKEGGI